MSNSVFAVMRLCGTTASLAVWVMFAAATSTPHMQWGPCDPSVITDTTLTCSFFEVPMDYHDASAGTARLALVKANATGERRGTMFFNPGGPGESGLSVMNSSTEMVLELTGGIYDIISWDARGTGQLTFPGEIYCFDTLDEFNTLFNGTVEITGMEYTGNFTDPADIDRVLAQAHAVQTKYEQVAKKCMDGPDRKYLKYVGAAATVRDMVSMADAINGPGELINYFGLSYGTLLGSWFVGMFPERIGRVWLDGVLIPIPYATEEISTHWEQTLEATDSIYQAMITGCALSGTSGCAIASQGDSPADIDAKIEALLKDAYDATLQNISIPLTSGNLRMALFDNMYEPTLWAPFFNTSLPLAMQIVAEELRNNATTTNFTLVPSAFDHDPRSYTQTAIYCGDSVDRDGSDMTDVFNSFIKGTQNVAHMVGGVWPSDMASRCSVWPVRSVERFQGPFNKTLANPILITSDVHDPITTLAGAQGLADALGDSAALAQVNGFGHTSIYEPSTCMTDIILAFMVNGTLPAKDTVCELDDDFEVFEGVSIPDILRSMYKATASAS